MATWDLPDVPFTPSALGLSPSAVRRALERGAIRRVVHGVYVDNAVPNSLEVRSVALQLVVPEHAFVCRSTSSWLFGVDVLPVSVKVRQPRVEVAVREGATALRRPGVVSYVEHLADDDITEYAGVRTTTPLRTAADLMRWLPRYNAVGAADSFLRSGLVDRPQLAAEQERWFAFKGVRQMRELVAFADPLAESPRESWLRLLLHDAGFPATVCQHPIPRPGDVEPFRLDLAIPDAMVGFEYDGEEFHPPEQVESDEIRRVYVRSRGWTLIVARRGDLERPQRLVDAVGYFVAPVRRARPGMGIRTGFVGVAA